MTNLFSNYSRSQIQLWLKERAVSVNGEPVKANYKVKQGDEITVLIPEPETLDVVPENIPLTIVYEDEDVAVINKPQGMVVHPSAGHTHGTMVNALMYHVRSFYDQRSYPTGYRPPNRQRYFRFADGCQK